MFKLLIKTGELKGKSYPIREGVVFIGRDPSNTITLPDRHVSRKHASISPQGSEFLIEDLVSRNGTMVNDRPVHQQILKLGDEVRIGSTLLEFVIQRDADGAPDDLKDDSP